MVLPEGTREPPPRKGGKVMALVATGVAAIALTGLMTLTSPDEETDGAPTTEAVIETPTTVSPFDPYQVGEPLTLQLAGTFHGFHPIATVYRADDLLVFSPLLVSSQEGQSGLTVRSARGDQPALATNLTSEFRISGVEAGFGVVVAAGVHIESGQPWAWTSMDGVQWEGAPLPVEGDSRDWSLWSNGIAIGPDVIAVAARGFAEQGRTAIEASLNSYLGVDNLPRGWDFYGSRLIVYGPLGIVTAVVEADELGLTSEQITQARTGYSFEDLVWVSTDGADSWRQTETGSFDVQSAFIDNHSNPVLVAYGPTGMNLVSFNGEEWVPGPRLPEIWEIHPWTDGLVSVFANRPAVSTDGAKWDRLLLDRLLPDAGWWQFFSVAGGKYGIATMAEGQPDGGLRVERQPQPFSLSRGAYVLALDDLTGTLELHEGSESISTTRLWNQAQAEHIVLDLAAETATFLDPATGESLVTFSFEEIEREENSRFLGFERFPTGPRYLLFSNDAETWRVGAATGLEKPGSFVTEVDISKNEIALTLVTDISASYDSSRTLFIEIWTADLN
ncbi:MAG: hypothetical protein U9N56_06425 [Actinomycetota bacterium]|nr:hypothetical protein [Actinomycetota bacterium]